MIRPIPFFAAVLLAGCSFALVSCDNEDPAPGMPDEITTDAVYGDYAGKMTALSLNPHADSGEEEDGTAGIDITATVKDDTLYFEDYPIRDIVLAIVKDEGTADNIVAAVGKVSYKVGYKPSLSAEKDSISLDLKPEPLKLSVPISSETEEEPQTLAVEVKVEAYKDAAYAAESGKLTLGIGAMEVLLGEGEGQVPLDGFSPISMDIEMNQKE